MTNYYYNLREVSRRFDLPVGKYCTIPSTFNVGEIGEFLIRVFVEKKWGSSEQSPRMSFRPLSSRVESVYMNRGPSRNAQRLQSQISPISSPKISPKLTPKVPKKCRMRSSSATQLKYASPNARHFPVDTLNIANIRKKIQSLNFCHSIDQEWEVFHRVVDIIKSKMNDGVIKE